MVGEAREVKPLLAFEPGSCRRLQRLVRGAVDPKTGGASITTNDDDESFAASTGEWRRGSLTLTRRRSAERRRPAAALLLLSAFATIDSGIRVYSPSQDEQSANSLRLVRGFLALTSFSQRGRDLTLVQPINCGTHNGLVVLDLPPATTRCRRLVTGSQRQQ